MFNRIVDVAAWLVVAFLLGPLLIIVAGSFTETPFVAFPPVGFTWRWYEQLMQRADFLQAFGVSLLVALLCTLGALGLGVPAAIGLHRHDFPGRTLLLAVLMSPLILPTIVTGVALLQFYYLIELDAPLGGLLAGHVVITIPYVLRTVGAGLAGLSPAMEEAAGSLGAPPWRVLARITLPAVAPQIMAAAIFVFITSFDQATVSIFLSGPDIMPLPVRIYSYIEFAVDPMIAAVSALLILFSFALVAMLQRLAGVHRVVGAS